MVGVVWWRRRSLLPGVPDPVDLVGRVGCCLNGVQERMVRVFGYVVGVPGSGRVLQGGRYVFGRVRGVLSVLEMAADVEMQMGLLGEGAALAAASLLHDVGVAGGGDEVHHEETPCLLTLGGIEGCLRGSRGFTGCCLDGVPSQGD
ncbi:MAG: hypothetical protein ACTSWP_12550 [Candidatus Freyarchaeota archaeon]